MKKILKTAAVALAGMLAIGLAACTDGDDANAPEDPKFYKLLNDKATNDSNVTAVWDFETNYADLSESEIPFEGIIPPQSGTTGATLDCTNNIQLRWNSKTLRLAANTASLNALSANVMYFTLTLSGQSNIQIQLKGTSSTASSKNLLAIVSKDNPTTMLVGKDNIAGGSNKEWITIEGAPAGEYLIYANGVAIYTIDVNATSPVTRATPVDGLRFSNAEYNDKTYVMNMDVCKVVSVPQVETKTYTEDGKEKYLTGAQPEWTVLGDAAVAEIVQDKKTGDMKILATASGEATVRARVGRFIADVKIKVTGDAKLELDTPEKTSLEATTEYVQFTAKSGNEDITKYVVWSSSDSTVASVEDGRVLALKAGTTTITAEYTFGRGEPQVKTQEITVTECDKTVITLLDTKDKDAKKRFPAQDTWAAFSEWTEVFKSVLKAAETGATYTVKDDNAEYTITNFSLGEDWDCKSVTSNVDDTQYPGILFTQVGVGSKPSTTTPRTFDVVIKPVTGKSVTLTGITASFRENKYNIEEIAVKSGSETVVSVSTPADKNETDKDWRDTRLSLKDSLQISTETTLTFSLTSDNKGLGDKFSIGDIKLFFEKEN